MVCGSSLGHGRRYKIYAESSLGEAHLAEVQTAARELVSAALEG